MVGQPPEEDTIPPGDSHRVTSEPLKQEKKTKKTLSQWVEPSERKPHTAGWPIPVRNVHMYVLITVYNNVWYTVQH